jgi:hypothetical protein
MENTLKEPLTFEQVMAILEAERVATMAKIEADKTSMIAKIEADRKSMMEAVTTKIEADKKLHQEQMQKRDAEMQKRSEEHKAELQKRSEEHKEEMQKRDAELKEFKDRMDNLSQRFGDVGNRLGEMTEYLVTPNLKEKFDKYGFYFRSTTLHTEVSDGKRNVLTDIDVLLMDGENVMAVEVKTKAKTDDIQRHILRMQQIQQFTPEIVKNKKVYGAIACAIINEEVKQAAFDAGFYVICQTGENVVIVEPPDNFVAKYWVTEK